MPNDEIESPQVTDLPAHLRSGRRISVVTSTEAEELRILGPDGDIELSVVLTADGPLLRFRGARLEIDSTGGIAVRCRSFELHAEENLDLQAGAELRLASGGDTHARAAGQTFIDADYVNLNCGDRSGYHDEGGDDPPALSSGDSSVIER